ncbi:MAG: hypothetical protein RLZZ488_2506 [Pseudomonadota bacterium]|jgi:pyrimidine deaminase RibD-like protein
MGVAWLEWNGVLYWSEYRRAPHEPCSALTLLVEGIWQRFPDSAHFILRARIFTSEPLTEMCRGAVVVCAKRSTFVPQVPDNVIARMKDRIQTVRIANNSPAQSIAHAPAQISRPAAHPAEFNRSVECWLLDAQGRLLATAANTSGRNRMRHAEMNLLKSWWQRERRPLPAGSRLVVTLEPCAMCGGAIWECVADRDNFEVNYVAADLGSAAARSVLRGRPMLRQCPNIGHPF